MYCYANMRGKVDHTLCLHNKIYALMLLESLNTLTLPSIY
jgi:hypothetical protein